MYIITTKKYGVSNMKKEPIGYTLETASTGTVKFFKDGKHEGCGVIGIESALEAIFVMENMSKKDWFICEHGIVYLVDREEFGKGDYSE